MARRIAKTAPVEAPEVEASEAAPVEDSGGAVVIRCEKFPSLLVTSPRVEFVDGLAVVSEEVAQVLLGLSPEFGLTRVDPVGE